MPVNGIMVTSIVMPLAVYSYFDKVQCWVQRPIDSRTRTWLQNHCGRGGVYLQNGPARFDARYRQRVELRQPDEQARQWVAGRDDALVNRAEMALDLLFACPADRDGASGFLHRHIVRRWHGKKQKVRVFTIPVSRSH